LAAQNPFISIFKTFPALLLIWRVLDPLIFVSTSLRCTLCLEISC